MLTATFSLTAAAQQASAPSSPALQAINVRKAIFTLIGSNFRPVGEVLQGRATYESVDLPKSANRVAFLAGLLNDAFPDNSAVGDTKARPEIWSNRADFDKRVKDFQDHSAALVQVAAGEKSGSDAFRAGAAAVGQDCKGCHENYKVK
ncbi:MAG: cytochrome c prime [Nevskia sp.]|nr:cytochrome c prime [Nevskia sp.]